MKVQIIDLIPHARPFSEETSSSTSRNAIPAHWRAQHCASPRKSSGMLERGTQNRTAVLNQTDISHNKSVQSIWATPANPATKQSAPLDSRASLREIRPSDADSRSSLGSTRRKHRSRRKPRKTLMRHAYPNVSIVRITLPPLYRDSSASMGSKGLLHGKALPSTAKCGSQSGGLDYTRHIERRWIKN